MVKKRQELAKTVSATLISILFVCSGILLDIVDYLIKMPDEQWNYFHVLSKDMQIIGFALIAFMLCHYKFLHSKVLLFLSILFKSSVLLINGFYFDRVFSSYTLGFLASIYILLLIRLSFIYNIKNREPNEDEAFYILFPVSSLLGLIQAIFLPWHPARYETRMVSDGVFLWSVFQKQFVKSRLEDLNIDRIQGVKVTFGRKLLNTERALLDSRVGKHARPGISDCRKLLVAGKV